jgi:hypothetical protein
MRTRQEVQAAIDDIERLCRLMEPATEKERSELVGVYAALRWTLGEKSGLDENLAAIRQILRAKAQ